MVFLRFAPIARFNLALSNRDEYLPRSFAPPQHAERAIGAILDTPEGMVDRVAEVRESEPAANPERQMWNRELSGRIERALEALTPRERTAGLQEPMFSSVQSVEPDASGKIQIAVDDVQRHVVTGSLQDRQIQELLLTAAREEANPGVREQSITVLENSADSAEVRRALTEALTHDPNTGVRLKAIGGLRQYADDAGVRKTLANVLLKDEDPGVRMQAIDLLNAHHDVSIVGVLQEVVQREDNGYIRTRCRDLLEAMKASIGTY